jgi:hypothetical protein
VQMALGYYDLALDAVPRVRSKPLLNKQFAASLSVAMTQALDALGFNQPSLANTTSSMPCAGVLHAYFESGWAAGATTAAVAAPRSSLESTLLGAYLNFFDIPRSRAVKVRELCLLSSPCPLCQPSVANLHRRRLSVRCVGAQCGTTSWHGRHV